MRHINSQFILVFSNSLNWKTLQKEKRNAGVWIVLTTGCTHFKSTVHFGLDTVLNMCTKSCYILSIVMWIWNNFLHFRSLYDIPNRIFQSIWVICPNLYTCLKSLAYNTPSTQITLIKIYISLAYNFPSIDTAWIKSACQGHYDLDNKPSLYFSYDFQFNLIKSFGLNCFVSHKKNR